MEIRRLYICNSNDGKPARVLADKCDNSSHSGHWVLEESSETLRLIELGLWAEKYKETIKAGLDAGDRFYYKHPKFSEAIEKLPK